MISMRTPVIREINALKFDVKRFDESCMVKYWVNALLYLLIFSHINTYIKKA